MASDEQPKTKRFVTLGRCFMGGAWDCLIYFVLRQAESGAEWVVLLVGGLPWLLFKIADNEDTGEKLDSGMAIGTLLFGTVLSALSSLPVVLLFALVRSVFR